MVRDWLNEVRFSRPRRCLEYASETVKLDANIDAVILWQSEQLHTNVLTRPGPSVGWNRQAQNEMSVQVECVVCIT